MGDPTTQLRKLCWGVLALVGLVLVGEIGGRAALLIFAPDKYEILHRVYSARNAWTSMMAGDAYLGYKLRPGLDTLFPSEGRKISIRTESFGQPDIGFRDIGTRPPFDGVAVGGSLTLCDDVPVEGCWLRYASTATGLSIATLGVNGYSTTAAVRMLDRYGRPFSPKLVLVEVFPNDFKDDLVFEDWLASGTDNYWLWAAERRGRGAVSRWLGSHSIIFRALDGLRRARTRRIHSYRDERLDFVFRLDGWWLALARDTEGYPGWPLVREGLVEFERIAEEMDAKLVVLIFPAKEQVYWDLVRPFADEPGLDPDRPTDAVEAFARSRGLAVCNLTDGMREEAARGRQLYHTISGHWNDAGGALAGAQVAHCLGELGLARE